MKFIVTIETTGSVWSADVENPFGDSTGSEVGRILHALAERVESTQGRSVLQRDEDDPFALRDANGKPVGYAYFEED